MEHYCNKKDTGTITKVIILVLAALSWAATCFAQVHDPVISDPNLDQQLLEQINHYRENNGKTPVIPDSEDYKRACLNAKYNYLTKSTHVYSEIKLGYVRSGDTPNGYASQYGIGGLLAQLSPELLLSNNWTAIAVYSKGNQHYIGFAPKQKQRRVQL